MQEELPLSAACYQTWLRQAAVEAKASRRGAAIDLVILTKPGGSPESTGRVRFRVRAEDWRVIGIDLDFGDAIFEVSEEESGIVGIGDVPPDVLAHFELPRTLVVKRALETDRAGATTLAAMPSSNLDDIEMDVRWALHEIAADLGEPVEILRDSSDAVTVSVRMNSIVRQKQIQEVLRGQAHVRFRLDLPSSNPKPIAEAPVAAPVPLSTARAFSQPVPHLDDERLIQWFGSSQIKESFARSVLEMSTAILAHLYALKDLAVRWSASSELILTPQAKTTLKAIVRDHVRTATKECAHLRLTIAPLVERFAPQVRPTAAGDDPGSWQAAVALSLAAARDADDSLRSLLTTSSTPATLDQALPIIQLKVTETDGILNSLLRTDAQR
jgi:hypothetical protein